MAPRKPASAKDEKPTPAEEETPSGDDADPAEDTSTDEAPETAPPVEPPAEEAPADDEASEDWPVDVGEIVLYRISQGDDLVPLLVTAVHGDTIDGVAFSANFRLIGNYRGAEPVRGARQGDGPREWRPNDG